MLASSVLLAAIVAACSSTSAGWTYAPAPPPTPVPSGSASGEPSTPASGEPSAAPSGSAAPSTGGSTVTITAQNIAFTTADVTAPAGGFTLAFDNEDAGVPHDVEIKDAGGASAFKTDIFPGVETRTYTVPALAAGAYTFHCTVHPNMTGKITVQ
jgi:plastocyanin